MYAYWQMKTVFNMTGSGPMTMVFEYIWRKDHQSMTIEYWNIIILYSWSWTKKCFKICGECECDKYNFQYLNAITSLKLKNICYIVKVIPFRFEKKLFYWPRLMICILLSECIRLQFRNLYRVSELILYCSKWAIFQQYHVGPSLQHRPTGAKQCTGARTCTTTHRKKNCKCR